MRECVERQMYLLPKCWIEETGGIATEGEQGAGGGRKQGERNRSRRQRGCISEMQQ